MFNVEKIRADFPSLNQLINGQPPIYFDNACMSLRPKQVINAITEYYEKYPACGDRSHHIWAEEVTKRCEAARAKIAKFINAKPEEIVFVRNTTEAINLVAQTLFNPSSQGHPSNQGYLVTSDKEHNSNLLPWQMLEKQSKIQREIVATDPDGTLDLRRLQDALWKPPRFPEGVKSTNLSTNLLSLVYSSNLDGVTNPVEEIIKIAHQNSFLVLLDAAQAAPHQKIDVKKLDVDFLAFSGHKMLGPSGIGVLYGKYELLKNLAPFLTGGDTVANTTYESAEILDPPHKFEAGLQDYAGIIGFGAAIDYLSEVGLKNVYRHEIELNSYLDSQLKSLKLPRPLTIFGPENPALRAGITTFTIGNLDHHKIALLLNSTANIMVRSGMFCVHSWFNERKIKGAVRVSLYLYNTKEEIDIFVTTLEKIVKL